jgi:uncharacterized membrane protein YheB (UPF0754 family)
MGGMVGLFGGDRMMERFRDPFVLYIKEYMDRELNNPEMIQALVRKNEDRIEANIKKRIEKLISDRLDELTPEMVKQIVQDMIRKHLGWLVVWGAVFGGLIGLGMSFIPL